MKPIIKWAGGKSQLIPVLHQCLPKHFETYYEPFLGGGALLFSLMPKKAKAGDSNPSLIHFYKILALYPEELYSHIEKLDRGGDYYRFRDEYNACISNDIFDIRRAALFLYLNKHCFNGLYRVNKKGLFNVPYNHSQRPSAIKEHLSEVSSFLRKVSLVCGDFEETCKDAQEGDFVFFDSPYDLAFQAYTHDGFSQKDHVRLAFLFHDLTQKGVSCLLTNHDTPLIRSLYDGFPMRSVAARRSINANGNGREGRELIIANYPSPIFDN